MDAIETLLNELAEAPPQDRQELRRAKARVASRFGGPMLGNDVLLGRYREDLAAGRRNRDARLEQALMLNRIRSESGIATVTVITEPFACPGRCVYCPTEARAPKSYLPNEPAVLRALRSDFDPYGQTRSRLQALRETGHATDKIELIIKGGTWSFYPEDYQRRFIQQCVAAANHWGTGRGVGGGGQLDETLTENETAGARIIGITIETRPDYVDEDEIRRLRSLGVTRVEIGVQTLEDSVLALIVRDHGTSEVRRATRLLKDAGLKVAYHLMPNLPGATPESDLRSFREVFASPEYRPDTLKLYPCVVIQSADLHAWWREGRYAPYDDATLLELLAQMKLAVPPYVRIERVIRDIPSTSIQAGCLLTNLREHVVRRLAEQGRSCACIRCRQVRTDGGRGLTPAAALPSPPRAERGGPGSVGGWEFHIVRRDYEASGGQEVFLSFEDANARLAALLRLRRPSTDAPVVPALHHAALIRELHTYGRHLALHDRGGDAAQHRGFGARLMAEAERIAREEFGARRMAVIAGVGVREYYRRSGYALEDTYMVKELAG